MVKNLKRFRKQVEREQGRLEALKCDFFPTTYVLPVSHSIDWGKKKPDEIEWNSSRNIIYSSRNLNEIQIRFGL